MTFMGLEPTAESLGPLLDTIEAQARGDLADLDHAALTWNPPGGGWSIAQVLEHLVIINTLYLAPMRSLVAGASRNGGAGREWKPSFMGRLLIKSVLPTARKRKTFRKLEPGPRPGTEVVARFLDTLHEIRELLGQARAIDMRKPRMTSPVSGLVRRLNLGDAFVITVAHAQRHMLQIERVIAAPGFPTPVTRDPDPADPPRGVS